MNLHRTLGLVLPCLGAACATSGDAVPRTFLREQHGVANVEKSPTTNRSSSRPLRLRQPSLLAEGRSATQFRYEENSESSGAFVSYAHGLFDSLTLDAQIGTGHQFETVSLAEEPGTLFDFGLQQALLGEAGEFRVAARLDIVLSDEASFEPSLTGFGAPLTFDEERAGPSKVNFQPALLFGLPLGDQGAEVYGLLGARLGDKTAPAYSFGAGLAVPLGKISFLLEADLVMQSLEGATLNEAYLTPGVLLTLRDKLDLSVGPSIGLTDESYDWRVNVTLGVRF